MAKKQELEAIVHQENYDSKHGGMIPTTGVLQWMAKNSSEGTGEEGEGMG